MSRPRGAWTIDHGCALPGFQPTMKLSALLHFLFDALNIIE
jgi:hypothetical protein